MGQQQRKPNIIHFHDSTQNLDNNYRQNLKAANIPEPPEDDAEFLWEIVMVEAAEHNQSVIWERKQ